MTALNVLTSAQNMGTRIVDTTFYWDRALTIS